MEQNKYKLYRKIFLFVCLILVYIYTCKNYVDNQLLEEKNQINIVYYKEIQIYVYQRGFVKYPNIKQTVYKLIDSEMHEYKVDSLTYFSTEVGDTIN